MEIKLLTHGSCGRLLSDLRAEKTQPHYLDTRKTFGDLEFINAPSGITLSKDVILEGGPDADGTNSIALYEGLQGMDLDKAADKRLWVGLTHGHFLDYSRTRWVKAKYSIGAIQDRFHFEGTAASTRLRNAIARLWWGAHLTVNPDADDPFLLTRRYWKNQDALQGLMERNLGLYPNLRKAFLTLLIDNPSLGSPEIRQWLKAINAAGGVKALPYLTEDEIGRLMLGIGRGMGLNLESNGYE